MSATTSAAGPVLTVPYGDCTLQLCPIAAAQVPYDPNLAGNVLFLSIFSFCFVFNAVLGLWFRTWSYMVAMLLGCMLEVLGYVGRVEMHYNPFPQNPFFLYLVCVTIASIFFTAAIYLTLSRLIVLFGERHSIFRPRTYTVMFISSDFLSLLLQAGGGVMVTMANDFSFEQKGLHVMQAGLVLQVVSLIVFIALCGLFAWSCSKHKDQLDERFGSVRMSKRFKVFLYAFPIATILMLIRCAFRVAELSQGFKGHIWFDQVDYMVLEGGMVSLCVLLLTFCHPGIGFCGRYREASFKLRIKKNVRDARVESYI